MQLPVLLSLLFSVPTALGWCGSVDPPAEVVAASLKMRDVSLTRKSHLRRNFLAKRNDTLVITTYVHIIESEALAGFVTDKMLYDQASHPPSLPSNPGMSRRA